MDPVLIGLLAELRLAVGFLGEKAQRGWWECNFLGQSSGAFLVHTYPRTTLLAQYHGVCEAAQLLHDVHVGVGQNYHPFRLPVSIEKAIATDVQQSTGGLLELFSSVTNAEQKLVDIASELNEVKDGPVYLGGYSDDGLEALIRDSAALYLTAFQNGHKCFPYVRTDNVSS